MERKIPRRQFLELCAAGLASVAINPSQTFEIILKESIKMAEAEDEKNVEEIKVNGWIDSENQEIILVPLRSDWFYNTDKEPIKIKISGSVPLNIRDNKIALMGGKFLGILRPNENNSIKKDVISGFTYTAEEEIYPNKLINIIQAAINILEWQSKNGGFKQGTTYSLLEMLRIDKDPRFKDGFNASGKIVRAGGVCGFATTFTKSIFEIAEFLERYQHPTGFKYFSGPGSPEITEENTDTTIEVGEDGKFDFRWRFITNNKDRGNLFLWVDALIIPNENEWSKDKKGTDFPADARLVLSLTWRTTPPPQESLERLQNLINLYEDYRVHGPNSEAGRKLRELGFQSKTSWNENIEFIKSVYPEENTSEFEKEIKNARENPIKTIKESKNEKELYMGLIFYLRRLVSDYKDKFPYSDSDYKQNKKRPETRLGDYIKNQIEKDGLTNAITRYIKKDYLDSALRQLNYGTYLAGDEPLQCVGFVSFLAGIKLNMSPVNIGGLSIGKASDLITSNVKGKLKYSDTAIENGLVFKKVESPEDVEISDMFVRYAGNNKNHVGVVIEKKVIEGKTILLVADANRKNDGLIRVFQVDENNFRVIFGEGKNTPPIVIRKTNK